MKSPPLEVWNHDANGLHLVGRIFATPGRGSSGTHFAFEYDRTWIAAPHRFSIDPVTLPLQTGTVHSDALFPALSDTGPDRWGCALIERQVARAGGRLQSLDYLLGLNDSTRVGSLRYRYQGQSDFLAHATNPIPPLLSLRKLLHAADAVQLGKEQAEDLLLLLGSGSPPGGARPKASVTDIDGTLAIAKFPRDRHEDPRSIAKGEILAMTLAANAGITVAKSRLAQVSRRDISIITRFDRRGDTRIPYISARTLTGANATEQGSYVAIADAIRQHGATPRTDLNELWRRMVFSRLVSNDDDHLRNHGFLRPDASGWRLAPAFDINPVPAHERRQHAATPISPGDPDGIDAALRALPYFGMSLNQGKEELGRIVSAILQWSRHASLSIKDREAYASAFENEDLRRARELVPTKIPTPEIAQEELQPEARKHHRARTKM